MMMSIPEPKRFDFRGHVCETPPSCSKLPTKSFPFSEKVFMPPPHGGEVAIADFRIIFVPGLGQYGSQKIRFHFEILNLEVKSNLLGSGIDMSICFFDFTLRS